MGKKLLLLLFCISFNALYSQSGWIIQNSGTYENLNGVYFPYNSVDSSISGLVVGNAGVVLKTMNSGSYWSLIAGPNGYNNMCVYFKSLQLAFMGSSNGNIYTTTNFGTSWTEQTTGAIYELSSITFSPSGNIGWAGNYNGSVFKTTNDGVNWVSLVTSPGYYAKVFALDDYRCWFIDNYGYVFRTTNSGTNFSSSRPVTSALCDVQFVTSTIGYAVGDSGKILRSTDGGITFTQLTSGTTKRLNSLYIINPYNIWIAGNSGLMLHSLDGGNSWIQSTYTSNNLKELSFVPGSIYGYCTGEFGTIIRTVEAPGIGGIGNGTNLVSIPFNTSWTDGRTELLYSASEITALTGLTSMKISSVGFNFWSANPQPVSGINIKMQNNTLTALSSYTSSGWTTVYSGNWTPATGIQYIALQTQFIWTSPQNLLVSICYDNASAQANSEAYATTTTNNSVFHNATNLIGLSGCTGITGATPTKIRPNLQIKWVPIPTGINTAGNELPGEFKLYQNYPNPFNPVTNIKYQIPENSFVTLKIYDILGKEVTTLVNEFQRAGFYEKQYTFGDKSNSMVSSSIYFYKIVCTGENSFTEVRKMVLIK
jgi:photosystem II stability/assembly factor-like uncharacterized protein